MRVRKERGLTRSKTSMQGRKEVAKQEGRKGKARARDEDEGDIGGWSIAEETAEMGRIDVRERWLNLAPVKDFCTVEEEG